MKLLILISFFVLSACSQPKRLNELPAAGVILSFGDSLTYGTGADKGHSYPDALAKLTQRKVINSGIPGELSIEGLARLPKLLQEHQPNVLLICHGGNDLLRKKDPEKLKQNLISMIQIGWQYKAEVVIIGVPEVKLFGGLHPVYQQVAEELNIPIESEALSKLLKNNKYKSDYVHLNNAGYQQLAQNLMELLQHEGAL